MHNLRLELGGAAGEAGFQYVEWHNWLLELGGEQKLKELDDDYLSSSSGDFISNEQQLN